MKELTIKLDLTKSFGELDNKEKWMYRAVLEHNLDISDIGFYEGDTYISLYDDGYIYLYINNNTPIYKVFEDLDKHITEIKNPENYNPEKAGKLREYLDYKLGKDKKWKVEL